MALPDAPKSRVEQYLAAMAGQNVETPYAPSSRTEQYNEGIKHE